jgi:hypothetical protein
MLTPCFHHAYTGLQLGGDVEADEAAIKEASAFLTDLVPRNSYILTIFSHTILTVFWHYLNTFL